RVVQRSSEWRAKMTTPIAWTGLCASRGRGAATGDAVDGRRPGRLLLADRCETESLTDEALPFCYEWERFSFRNEGTCRLTDHPFTIRILLLHCVARTIGLSSPHARCAR